jgi:hypothetical protein
VKEEKAYLDSKAKASYKEMDEVRGRLMDLLHHWVHRKEGVYRKRTEIAVDIVWQLESEGCFPNAHYAFDSGVLTKPLSRLIESHGKQWVSEIECNRHINWRGEWRRADWIGSHLRENSPESFRHVRVRLRNGDENDYWAFTKSVRLKKLGKKRLVIVHEREDLSDEPRFLLSSALNWESSRVIQTWSYRWGSEIFHEISKQVTGMESSQVRR